jgi:hypothetical protein
MRSQPFVLLCKRAPACFWSEDVAKAQALAVPVAARARFRLSRRRFMKMFARLMTLIVVLGMLGADAAAQVVPTPVNPAAAKRLRRSYMASAPKTAVVARKHRRHRHHRRVVAPVAAAPVQPF